LSRNEKSPAEKELSQLAGMVLIMIDKNERRKI
jgi:hypothetical protein